MMILKYVRGDRQTIFLYQVVNPYIESLNLVITKHRDPNSRAMSHRNLQDKL